MSKDNATGRNEPVEVQPGQAFTIGKHEMQAGWDVVVTEGRLFSVTGKVKNVSDTTSTAFMHFKLLDAQGEVLGNVQCNSGDLEPGQTQTLNCIPDGAAGTTGEYVKVTAEATF
jgi:hypothetical protein